MRKNMLMLLAAALLVVTGCKKDNKTENNGEKMIFTATIDNGAKTQINGYDQVWNTGDKVNINGEEFTVTPKAGDPSWATFEGLPVDTSGGTYKAIFPNSYYVSEDLYNFPATQTYNGNNLSGVNPLYAESTTRELVFHNICALMKLTLKGNGTDEVTEIKVSADQALSGYFEVKERGEGYFAELVTSGGSADVTLMCGDGVALTAEGTAFYIAIPEYDDYSNLTFTATTSEGKTWTYKAGEDGSISVAANYLYESTQTPVFVSPAPTKPEGALSGLFTINEDGKQVWFSKGNLYAKKDNGTWSWHFYDNQYGYNSLNIGDSRTAQSTDNEIDLFTWGYGDWSTDPTTTTYLEGHTLDGEPFNPSEDWGSQIGDGKTWRTLTTNEWKYLFNTRTVNGGQGAGKSYSLNITYGGKMGLVLYPDDYDKDPVTGTVTDLPDGVVFLPAAGYRDGSSVNNVGVGGLYWSSTACGGEGGAHEVEFYSSFVFPDFTTTGSYGYSVRLITESK